MKGNRFGWVAVLFFGSGIPLFIWQIVASRRSPVAVERRAVALAPGGAGMTQAGGEAATFTADVDETDAATTEAARDTVKFLSLKSATKSRPRWSSFTGVERRRHHQPR
jgi:hypothetical protein